MCDAMYQSEYEMHMFMIEHWEEEKEKAVEKLGKQGLPGMMLAMMYYGVD